VINDIFIAQVESIASNGAGVMSNRGQRVFADCTAPDDIVRARITEDHKGWARAELLEIVEPSPKRIAPLCPLFGKCGGCSLQQLSYDAQIAEKVSILKSALTRIGGLNAVDIPELQIKSGPAFAYRNRVQFHCSPQGIGFKVKQSEEIVPITHCPVAATGINDALAGRSGEIAPSIGHDRFTVYSYQDAFLVEGRKSKGTIKILDKNIVLDAGVFFQSNAVMLEMLIKDIITVANGADASLSALDMYCGIGTFALFLKTIFPVVDMVEENRTALNIAREFVSGAGREHFALSSDQWAKTYKKGKKYGLIVADPPRQGLSTLFRAWLCSGNRVSEENHSLLAYVSCDPATLARDSKELIAAGWRLDSLTFYDFYPQTAHIESLSVFEKQKSEKIVVGKNTETMFLSADASHYD
jgi:23S rRNA (uracil1939-C5)-methyltransferase